MKSVFLLTAFFVCGQALGAPAQAPLPPSKKWMSNIPQGLDDSKVWTDLVGAMREKHFHYGAVAASERMLQYFSDLPTKEFAYESLVQSIDEGYPYSLSNDFISGDVEVSNTENFAQSYNLYKATANLQKNMAKWADNYLNRVDKATFPKYLFFKALESNRAGKTDETLRYLDQTLLLTKTPAQAALATKAARTLARVLYEQGKYEQSLEIYKTYLLKLNPVQPQDWIEAAWNLYRLSRHDEALGMLFNLQAKPQDELFIEPYIIRSLIYREKCDPRATAALAQAFESAFGSTLEAIKTGQTLKSLPLLKKIHTEVNDYGRPSRVYNELDLEKKRVKELPSKLRSAANFLYSSEMANLTRQRDAAEEDAWDAAARNLLVLSESMRFLKFDVAREKYNPDKVFATEPTPPLAKIDDKADQIFDIHWVQWGDFWRDERLLYRADLKSRCQ